MRNSQQILLMNRRYDVPQGLERAIYRLQTFFYFYCPPLTSDVVQTKAEDTDWLIRLHLLNEGTDLPQTQIPTNHDTKAQLMTCHIPSIITTINTITSTLQCFMEEEVRCIITATLRSQTSVKCQCFSHQTLKC